MWNKRMDKSKTTRYVAWWSLVYLALIPRYTLIILTAKHITEKYATYTKEA